MKCLWLFSRKLLLTSSALAQVQLAKEIWYTRTTDSTWSFAWYCHDWTAFRTGVSFCANWTFAHIELGLGGDWISHDFTARSTWRIYAEISYGCFMLISCLVLILKYQFRWRWLISIIIQVGGDVVGLYNRAVCKCKERWALLARSSLDPPQYAWPSLLWRQKRNVSICMSAHARFCRA